MKSILNIKKPILIEAEDSKNEDSDVFEDEDSDVQGLDNENNNEEKEKLNTQNSEDRAKDLTKDSPWGKIYKEYKNKDIFWKLYYEIVWEKDADKVKDLGEAFKQELTVFGFNEKLNPMIGYVKKYLLDFNLNSVNYSAIHDSLVREYINKKDVAENGILRNKNILFCKDLYSKSYQDILEYLSLQNKILKLKNIKAVDNTGKTILKMSDNNTMNLSSILMLNIELQDKPIFIDSEKVKILKLRDQEDILIYLQSLGQENIETNKSESRIVASQFKELVNSVQDMDDAKVAMFAIATRYAAGTLDTILNNYKETSKMSLKDIVRNNSAEKYQQYLEILVKAGNAPKDTIQTLINSIGSKQGAEGQNLLNKVGK